MLPEKIYLVDLDKELVEAWEEVFENDKAFEPYQDDYFARKADAIVSPANSFGIMDGGLDLAIRNKVGYKAEALGYYYYCPEKKVNLSKLS